MVKVFLKKGSEIKMNRKKVFIALCMALFMSFFMSFVMSAANAGFVPHFLNIWLRSWLIGFLAALPLAFILPPAIQKLAVKLKI
jgi:Protein of unknown function (DUF2798).